MIAIAIAVSAKNTETTIIQTGRPEFSKGVVGVIAVGGAQENFCAHNVLHSIRLSWCVSNEVLAKSFYNMFRLCMQCT